MDSKIVVIENDNKSADYINHVLYETEIEHIVVRTREEAWRTLEYPQTSLVILNNDFPGNEEGVLLKAIRGALEAPIIVLISELDDKILGRCWRFGANDFIESPIDKQKLVIKINKLCKLQVDMVCNQGLEVDEVGNVFLNGELLYLSPLEFKLLSLLISKQYQFVNYETIWKSIWNNSNLCDYGIVRVNINRLRKKLNDDSKKPKYIISQPGKGYCLVGETKCFRYAISV